MLAPVDSISQVQHPNILWIIAEDMSQDQACYGNGIVKTPVIDKLAADGMRFTHMFTAAGVCAPSRSAIATGIYQNGIGAMHMRYADHLKPNLPDGIETIAQILRDHGYQTVGKGKKDYMFKIEGEAFEFEDIAEIDPKKPFFARINSHYTHRIFKNDSLNPISPNQIALPPYYPNVGPLRDDWAAYLENIQLLDREVGNMLDRFEEFGLLENTTISFYRIMGDLSLRENIGCMIVVHGYHSLSGFLNRYYR
ncbi:MAG: sulfatase-like hydrolase/transferase [Saprospiraceae bacterium]|nr:sulfatase-like hydrolase/transferase [Saprospiraceae bacterium]